MNLTGIVQSVHLASSTKDSLHLQWRVNQLKQALVSGYKVRYQAVGSNVVQFSPLLANTKTGYDIAMLHEDTNYDICVQVYTNGTDDNYVNKCIQASTSTDSLTVALGSTFGAFLALGIIVMFVFVAKWQHQRRQQKLELQQVSAESAGESYDSLAPVDGDYEMSDVSLQVHEDTAKLEFSSQSSQAVSMTANGTIHINHLPPDIDEGGESDTDGNVTVHEPPDLGSSTSGESSPQPSTSAKSEPAIAANVRDGDSAMTSLLHSQPYHNHHQDERAPDVRPKDKALLDLTYMYANKKLFEQPQTQLRPNMSCNW
ncbi:hypothetical protein LSH36_222g01013 [Paralvinella palmiformis]|uniref:Fibronectin type-III domain-containing protein n=1 Tax=Paralvinella palmiformis TaxID=53620 RepID=A0AAD9JP76_9ANNE|nr:hypothetical protein LSH36_222g01013 [Paralvinella palmiformis]